MLRLLTVAVGSELGLRGCQIDRTISHRIDADDELWPRGWRWRRASRAEGSGRITSDE